MVKKMGVCGFCKQSVDIHTFTNKTRTKNSCIEESDGFSTRGKVYRIYMLSCPHCNSVLGFFTTS